MVLSLYLGVTTTNFLLGFGAILCKVAHFLAVEAGTFLIASGKALYESICHCFPIVSRLGTLTRVLCGLVDLSIRVGYGL